MNPARPHRRLYPGVLVTALLVAVLAAGSRSASGEVSPAERYERAATSECTVREVSRSRLQPEPGEELYLEPRLLVESARHVLLLGKPSYLWETTDTTPRFLNRNEVFGVTIEPDGAVHVVPNPRGTAKVAPVAAASIDSAGWGVIFFEMIAEGDQDEWYRSYHGSGRIERIWYAEYRRPGWSGLVELPLAPAERIVDLNGSALVVSGDTMVWAVPAITRDSARYGAVFERVRGTWHHLVVDHGYASPPNYAVLVHTPTAGFLLGFVQADYEPRYDNNSLFLYARSSEWSRVRKLIVGAEAPVHHPSLLRQRGDTSILSWVTESYGPDNEGRALWGNIADGPLASLTVDPAIVDAPVPLSSWRGGPFWLTTHFGDSTPRLRLHQARDEAVTTIWEADSPFTGAFGAVAVDERTALISGPLFEPERSLVSLLIGLQLHCPH